MKNNISTRQQESQSGAALIVALWVLIVLSLIVGSFAFEMQLESRLVSFGRKKFQAEMLAASGIEYARAVIDKQNEAKELEIEDMPEDDGGFMQAALYIKRGLTATLEQELGNGKFTITIAPAESKRNANKLTREQWLDLFEISMVPPDDWDFLIDCLEDWKDQDENHGINGAESDDPFYEERGYPCKNDLLDSVEELSLVKGWNDDILYGRPATDKEDAITGIADELTVWGDGKINVNTVSEATLRSMDLDDLTIEQFMQERAGLDTIPGTSDDGFKTIPPYLDSNKFKLKTDYIKVTSIGDVYGNRYQISCIFLVKPKNSVPVYWKEGPAKE